MATLLFKTEPSEYAFADLLREGRCVWSGVRNPQALEHLRHAKAGDEVLIYHTGSEKAIAGLARVVRGPYEDPRTPGTTPEGKPKFAVVDLVPVRATVFPVSLAAIKKDRRFASFALVKNSRLSVMPVPAALDRALRALAGL